MTSTPLVLSDAAKGRSFLVVVGRLDGTSLLPEGLFFQPIRGGIDDIGFCHGRDQNLSDRPPRPEKVPYDSWCRERFFLIQPAEHSSSLGSVDVKETLVYDDRMRGDIDFTGIMVTLSLQQHAYDAYLDHVGLVRQPELLDHESWDGRILLRIPARPFAFPMPRGSAKPWQTRTFVGELQPIVRFTFDEIEIQPLRDNQGRRVTLGEAACDGDPGWQAPLRLRA
ncbi:hypothetical protein [Bradyrhizobium sp. SZCCHNS3002]|uniref:hypothetical protein n=1 Tax=Bradyrhizobium sp. SZCCHNS3002 TaxID=3057310 RepID=UPI0028E79EEF|nr:hypothetical protein [Bradyrhizobium sp. SZCCHNS3002]